MTNALIEPDRSALLLMDFQAGVVESLPEAETQALLERVAGLRAWARAQGIPTFFVRVAFNDDTRRAVPERNKAFSALAGTDRFDENGPAVQIHAALRPQPDDAVVTKTRVGAFSTTDLADRLATRGIDTLILAGIATSGVVLSTLRDAADHDYRLIVVADCCADRDPLVHEVLTQRVFPRQADVVDAHEITARLRSSGTSP